MTDLEIIEARMASGEPFTFGELHSLIDLSDKERSYRLADRTIQKWRKRGLISFVKNGRDVVWSLTDSGKKG